MSVLSIIGIAAHSNRHAPATHKMRLVEHMAKPDPFGNRIAEIMLWDATDEPTDYTIDDGFEAADMWDLPEAYVCIIRSQSESGKITEKAYRSVHAARKFVNKCLENEDDLLILTENTMSVPFPTDGPESL